MVNMIGFHHQEPRYNTAGFGQDGWFASLRPRGERLHCATPCARASFGSARPSESYTEHPGDISILARLAIRLRPTAAVHLSSGQVSEILSN